MDPEGYVRMDQIMPFNRIRKCSGGDPYLVRRKKKHIQQIKYVFYLYVLLNRY